MNSFIHFKPFNYIKFAEYLNSAVVTNQFSNYGASVRLLETRARDMLKISSDKAIIAVNNGASALHAMLLAIKRKDGNNSVFTQDFTFPCNMQGPAEHCIVVDLDVEYQIDLSHSLLENNRAIIIVTNCFGHLQNLNAILEFADRHDHLVIFDNAATPYSFWKGTNSCNLGTGAYISLHQTKPIGFGEGGLVIIDNKYEEYVRSAVNFGIINGVPSEFGSNFKMSELAAAGILQWWDSFDIDELAETYRTVYEAKINKYLDTNNQIFPHYGDDKFFPNCLPIIHDSACATSFYAEEDARKYYKPFIGLPNSKKLYNNIACLPITENLNA